MSARSALVGALLSAAPALAGDGVTGFWISLGWPTAAGALVVLFGAFCALWAQNTGRNAWQWFALGALFHVFAVGAVLYTNAQDQQTLAAARLQGRAGL
jgi:hypothetical protein